MKRPAGRSAGASGRAAGFLMPCLATAAAHVPEGPQWVHEIKYDGYRAQAHVIDGRARLLMRSGVDWSWKFEPVCEELAELDVNSAIIDGELIVEDARGVPDFHALQRAIKDGPSQAIHFMAFDLLELEGRKLRERFLLERKAELQRLLAGRPPKSLLRFSEHFADSGGELLQQACALGLEGVVSKRTDRAYRSGRSNDWLKVKCVSSERFVVGGYVPQVGAEQAIGSLALGYFEDGALSYAGRVGTGFSADEAYAIWHALQVIRRAQPPFAGRLQREQRQGVVWVEPRLVVEVEFRDWTHDQVLRHAVFRRLCLDDTSLEVGRPSSLRMRV